MTKIILFITLLSLSAYAAENTRDLDVRKMTNLQIRVQAFDLMHFKKHQETLDFCNKILWKKLYHSEAHFWKGMALAKLNKDEEAIKFYDLALKYNRVPFGEVYYYKGISLEKLEKLEEALNAYDLAIENNFDYRYVFYFREGILMKMDQIKKKNNS